MPPYKWYVSFKLAFEPTFRRYCHTPVAERTTSAKKKVGGMLDDVVLDYLIQPPFEAHMPVAMDFAKMANGFLYSEPAAQNGTLCDVLLSLTEHVWNTFADIARMENHNDYYSDSMPGWRAAYDR